MRLLGAFLVLMTSLAVAQDTQAIDRSVQTFMRRRGVPGVSVALVKDGKVAYLKGYGLADVENDVPATPDTVYEIGSVTKQFTAAIVLQLMEEGKVKLDEPARTYLPDLPEAWKVVTVRHLLTHTSGIKSYTELPGFEKLMREPMSRETFLDLITPEKPDFSPGEKWKYDNSGYFLLGMLIEKVTGHSYRDELQRRILKPLGMTSTDVNDGASIVKHRARGYVSDPKNGPRNAPYIDMSWPFAAGAILSTVRDLAKWDAALYSDRPVKQTSWKQAWTPVKLNDGSTYPYGFGWALGSRNGVSILEHGGDIPGFNADILRIPSKKLTVIVLCNTDPGVASPIAQAIAALVDPSLKEEIQGIADANPLATAKDRALFEAFANGSVKKDDFTEAMQARIFPSMAQAAREFLSSLGPVERFVLVKVETDGALTKRSYRIVAGGQGLGMMVARGADRKVSGMQLIPN